MSESGKAVFLSYASQDGEAAKRIADALRAAGVEVWFDTDGGLEHGDEWDAKIRRQIKECVLFIAIVSAHTQAREEGYFRIEWELAAQRALGIASGVAFILPVVIDDTKEPAALVPDRFRSVQWTRLPDGNVPADVLQRFLKLWSHRTGAVKHLSKEQGTSFAKASEDRAGSREQAESPGSATPATTERSKWLRPILASGAIVIAVLAITLFKQRDREIVAIPPPLAPALAPVSAARQLVLRARELCNFGDFSREKLEAAGDLVDQALKLDPTDAMAWAISAQIDALMVYRALDYSDERRETAAKRAARARALAPNDFETRHADAVVAGFMRGTPEMLGEAESAYRQLLRERPHDADLLEEFGTVLTRAKHYDEAAAVFTEAGRPLQAGWAYFRVGGAEDALRTAERSLAGKRSAGALVLKANVELVLIGDCDAAQETVSQLTPTELLEESAAVIALRVAVLRRDPARILELLGPIPHAFVSVTGFTYPRQYWTGFAQSLLGHPEAAQAEWRRALAAAEERLKSSPNNPETLGWVAILHAMVGEKAAAERALELYSSYKKIAPGRWDFQYGIGLMFLGDRKEEALDRVSRQLREDFFPFLYVWARYSPEFDPLRGDPRFEKMLRETLPKGAKPFDEPKSQTLNPGSPDRPAVDQKSVAVLAFANLSDDKANEYFSDGISEELLNVLAKVPGLKVTARTSSFHFKGKDTPISEIAQQLGVAYVVEGSVRKSGDKVRITAQLIKAADGFHVWSDTFTRELKDVFAVQDEIAGLIAKNLELKMDIAAKVAVKVDPEAYRLYLEGRQILQRRTLESYTQAEKLFTEARALAPEWAPVYAGLADAARLRAFGTQGPSGPDSPWLPDMKTAKTLADRALELDPSLAEAYVSLGGTAMIAWNFPEAERLIRRALELNPNQADAYLVLGRVMSAEGRMDESLAALRRAVDLNPLAPRILDNLAAELGFTGRNSEAWEIIERANALQPDSSQIQCYRVRLLADMGRREEALVLARRMVENPNPEEREFRLIEAARAFALFGLKAEAAAAAAQVPADVPEYVIVQAYLGVPEKAVPLLGRLSFGWVEDLLWGYGFDPIRHDPGYIAYLARTGLTESNTRAQAWRAAHPPEKPEPKP